MKYRKSCPECGGEEIYAKSVDAVGGYGPDLLPKIGRLFTHKYFEIYICGSCGYTQFHVPEKFLPDVKKNYLRIK